MGAWHGMMASLNSEFPEAERGLHERRRVPELGGEGLRPLITAAGRRRRRCRSNSRCRGRRRLAATLEIHGAIGGQEM